jgi:predicted glycosyltransferase
MTFYDILYRRLKKIESPNNKNNPKQAHKKKKHFSLFWVFIGFQVFINLQLSTSFPDVLRRYTTFCDVLRRDLQTQQTPKQKTNPKQARPKMQLQLLLLADNNLNPTHFKDQSLST